MRELLEAVREGRPQDVAELLWTLDAGERKAALEEFKAIRAELRGWGWNRWEERRRVHHALLVAGAGCHTGAAAVASWIGARDLRDFSTPPHPLVLAVLRRRDPAWLGDVAHRLAGRAATAREDYPLIHGLVRRAGCPVPVTDGYVHGWVHSLSAHRLLPDLSADPQTPVLVPRLFETAELDGALVWQEGWVQALVALPRAGVVERDVLVDGCLARLLRGGKPSDLRFLLDLLRALGLTADEERARTADWMGLAADAPSSVAGYAQEVLGRLAASGELSARQVAEVSASLLFRTEKKLVRAQLVLVGKVLRRDAAAAGELLPVLAEVFGHSDTAFQERALKLVGRHLDAVDDATRRELADTAAALLSSAHREAAAALFGELPDPDDAPGPYEELLPPPPEPQRVAPVAGALPELVEEVAVLLRSADPDGVDTERALDGLTRAAHEDVEALREALLPLLPGLWWYDHAGADTSRLDGVQLFVAALVRRVGRDELLRQPWYSADACCVRRRLARVSAARVREAAFRAVTEPLPFLLATPTWQSGALDPAELVDRLAVYRRLGVRHGECDMAQALLRVRRTGPGVPEAAEAATALGTPEGDRLAAWLTGGGTLFGPGTREVVDVPRPRWAEEHWPTRRIVVGTPEQLVLQREFPPAFRSLGRPWTGTGGTGHCGHSGSREDVAVLPQDRETLAAWLLPLVTRCADDDHRGAGQILPVLAEAGGEAGPSLHLAVACGLGARHTDDRLAAVDALLVLASRGELDAARLGGDLAELVALGTVKVNRLADALRTTAATGAYGTVWTALAGALPGLLSGGEPPRGLGEILAVAADCAERCGAVVVRKEATVVREDAVVMREDAPDAGRDVPGVGRNSTDPGRDGAALPGLAELAARRGSSQLVVQAKRLAKALG
ncbi:DUF6493 family protein [Streptomyces thermolilacinus]|uniref:PBS lyase n=1 Tax=Streptomyces thermolilacinus SPC6 TaxID=1306406 RepID=A0A1D3DY75_9ACTN|nr:DUF6493 family protein [Streptomyces thermolilacinus]OEJ97268.1 hypothetical protein J116_025255 [Streptomyces thermolilacinus SPC6]